MVAAICLLLVAVAVFVTKLPAVHGQSTPTTSPQPPTGMPGQGDLVNIFKGARRFPICIQSATIMEYQSELKEASKAASILQQALKNVNSNNRFPIMQSPAPGAGVGIIQQITYSRIHTNLEGDKTFRFFKYLRQWIHIKIQLTEKVDFLVVQANAYPWGMAWGVFDIEFAGKDCGSEYNVDKAKQNFGKALDLNGHAAVIPCHRRSYLHSRHPYVYVYAGPARSEFHMNYNFLDVTCRETKMIQLLILTGKGNAFHYYFTAVIDHFNYHDSTDGMPYPFHVDLVNSVTMHEEDRFAFQTVKNGERAHIPYNKDFDDCVVADDATFMSKYRDGTAHLSDWVCRKPLRYACNFDDKNNVPYYPGDTIDSGGGELCVECTHYDNNFTREVSRRIIQRGYLARRFHGYAMILGCISLAGVNSIVARYFKETKGCCLLVGWWLWVHLLLNFIAKGAIWGSFALAIFLPPRMEVTVSLLISPRKLLINIHSVIGGVVFLLFNIGWIAGLIRPLHQGRRGLCLMLHSFLNYAVIIVAVVAVIFSTACFEVKIYACVSVLLTLIAFIVGWVIQVLMDDKKRLVPPRRYCPVVEAITVPKEMPCCMARTVLIVGFSVLMLFIFFLTVAKGSYVGLFIRNACSNCKWKWDENVRLQKGAGVTQMYEQFGCELSQVDYKILL